jgi:hypothetical protein
MFFWCHFCNVRVTQDKGCNADVRIDVILYNLEQNLNAWYFLCFLSAVSIFLAFANEYLLRLQTTIAITSGSVVMSLLLMLLIKFSGNEVAESIGSHFKG